MSAPVPIEASSPWSSTIADVAGSPGWAATTSPQHTDSMFGDFAASSLTIGSFSEVAALRLSAGFESDETEDNIGDDYTVRFFLRALLTNKVERRRALELRCAYLKRDDRRDLLEAHAARVVRMATSCPLREWREVIQELLQFMVAQDIALPTPFPVSAFFPPDAVLPAESEHTDVRRLFREQFLETARLSYLQRILAFRPDYATRFRSCQRLIMREPGPLPFDTRNYIAILAASQHRCSYLVELQTEEFLLNGGDPSWLEGIEKAPQKLKNFATLDCLAAFQPWLLSASHLSPLLKGADSWTIGELVHAMVIAATFRALCGIVKGCGVQNEADFVESVSDASAYELQATAAIAAQSDADARLATESIAKRFRRVDEGEIPECDEIETEQGSALVEQFKAVEEDVSGPVRPPPMPQESHEISTLSNDASSVDLSGGNTSSLAAALAASSVEMERDAARLSRFIGDHGLRHADFDVRAKHYDIFRANDYSWSQHGYELLARFLPKVAAPLDELFTHTYTMTDNKFNTFCNVDTGPFRRAVWQYVQRIKGVLHDDYNYRDINVYLNKFNKAFVKKIVCYPESITVHDFVQLGYDMAPYEKAHICALAVESRKQAELLYGLNALMKFLS